ncbi:hypothetical protein ACI77D_26820, partial [Pseudomonas sp. O39]
DQQQIKSRARRPESRPEWLKQKQGKSTAGADQKQNCFSVGAGLPAMQTPRSTKYTELMPSQRFGGPTSQLPH